MKKILSVLLCVILLCSVSTYFVNAQTNYCELFRSSINSMRWSMEIHGNSDTVLENQSFPMDVIFDNIKMKTMFDYYKEGEEYAYIPASVFEAKAKKCFAVIDVNAMRAYEEDEWNQETQSTQKRRIYDATKNAYVFIAAGGMGDPSTYAISGYVVNGSKYTVYSHFIDLSEPNDNISGVEGKDYFVYEGEKYKIYHSLKNVVETDGKDVKFHSWQKISAVPTVSGMITPSTKFEDKKPTQSKPQNTTSSTPSQASKNESTTSPVTSQITSSAPEDVKALVTVAETETAKLETEQNVFPKDTVIKLEQISEEKEIETIKTALENVSQKFVAYEITAVHQNASVQPNGKVKATFNIPDGYDFDKVAVFYVADDGTTEKLSSTVDKETKTVIAELSHFSTYVVAETNTVESVPEKEDSTETIGATEETEKERNNAVIWIIIAVAAVVIVGGGLACFFIFKKKA